MTTTWFMQSRGRLSHQDYSWAPATAPGTGVPSPGNLLAQGCGGRSISDIVDDSKSSLLLYTLRERPDRKQVWILLMTGLHPTVTAESDHMNRDIRVSVLGAGTGPVPPSELAAVACLFLTGGLQSGVPVSYGLRDAKGFAVDADAWAEVIARATDLAVPPADRVPGPDTVLLDTDSPANRQRAAGMLVDLTSRVAAGDFSAGKARLVGTEARPFLVVTSLLGAESLKRLMPWCGLSERVSGQELAHVSKEWGRNKVRAITGKGVTSGLAVYAVLTVLAAIGAMIALLL
ncbi:hypothetical protein ACFYO0_40945 [Streptomyces sp. NPDC006365]|uniref:hypothetical protein n=1 Tax=Streptomyces sp. NPDC006365 TaxID=3364744 RepID=UPI00368EF971